MKPDKNNTYCHYPFRELAMKEYENDKLIAVWPCCMMGNIRPDGKPLSVIEDPSNLTPQEIYDHPRMQQLRENMINGKRDELCKVCWDQEDRGLLSFRHFSESSEIEEDNTRLSSVDISASNLCNLRCRMCTPRSSHSLMIDHDFFKKAGESDKTYPFNFILRDVAETTQFFSVWETNTPIPWRMTDSVQWKWLMENTDKIRTIKASGGEPFYDNKVIKLIDRYIETDNAKHTTLSFHTNGTLLSDELINKLNKFKSNLHNFSIDGYRSTYNYVRYPGNFDDLDKNLRNYWTKINPKGIFRVNMVLTSLNLLSVIDFVKWIDSIYTDNSINFAEVYGFDRGTSINRLPIFILQQVKNDIEKFYSTFKKGLLKDDHKTKNLIQQINNAIENNKEDKRLMLKEIGFFDISRNQKFTDYLDPILINWLSS